MLQVILHAIGLSVFRDVVFSDSSWSRGQKAPPNGKCLCTSPSLALSLLSTNKMGV